VVDDAEHADVVKGIPVVLGDPELAGRLVVKELYGGKTDIGDHAAEVWVGIVEGFDEVYDLTVVEPEAGEVLNCVDVLTPFRLVGVGELKQLNGCAVFDDERDAYAVDGLLCLAEFPFPVSGMHFPYT
jgi:hypothetical protein